MNTRKFLMMGVLFVFLSMLVTTVSAWEQDTDGCMDCQDVKSVVPFHKLWCKPFRVVFSEMTGKLTVSVETETHGRNDLQRFVFYNATGEMASVLDDNLDTFNSGGGCGHWVNIYYTVNETDGRCSVIYVEKAELNGGDIATLGFALWLPWVIIFVIVFNGFIILIGSLI